MFQTSALKLPNLLPLRSNDIRALLKLGKYTDLDYRINTTNIISTIKESLKISYNSARQVVQHLKNNGFLNKGIDGHYYSNFSERGNVFSNGYHYIPYFSLFEMKSDKDIELFREMKERELKLFFYILTSTIPGRYHNVSAEIMYMNKTRGKDVKLSFFDSYRDFSTFLKSLVQKDLLQVRFIYKGKQFYIHKDNCNTVFPILDEFCGVKNGERKKRFGKGNSHVMQIRVNPTLIFDQEKIKDEKDAEPIIHSLAPENPEDNYMIWKRSLERKILSVYEHRSTIQDLIILAERYHHDIDWLQRKYSEEFKSVHILKQNLFEKYGTFGVQLFRRAVKSYFEATPENFSNDISDGTFTFRLENYFVFSFMRKTFLDEVTPYLEAIKKGGAAESSIQAVYNKIDFKLADSLLQSINDHQYPDQKVLLGHELSGYIDYLDKLKKDIPQLGILHADVINLHKEAVFAGLDPNDNLTLAKFFKLGTNKQKRRVSEMKESNKKNNSSISDTNVSVQNREALFYNWLEE